MKRRLILIAFVIVILWFVTILYVDSVKTNKFVNSYVNATLTEYNKGIYEVNSTDSTKGKQEAIKSSLRILEQVNLSQLELLTKNNIANDKNNNLTVEYFNNLLGYTKCIYVNFQEKDNESLEKIYCKNQELINLTSNLKTRNIFSYSKEEKLKIKKILEELNNYLLEVSRK